MNTADFETDAGRAAKVAEKRAKEIDAAFRKAGVAIGAALGAAAVAVGAAVKQSIDHMDEMSKAAQKVGQSTEEFSKLVYAGSLADVSMDQLVTTMGRLTKAQAAALDSGSQQAKIFDALSISVKNADGSLRSSSDVLLDFADRFKELKGSPEAMAAGFAIFGKSFQDIIPLIKDGADGLREAGEEAERLGVVIDSDAAKAAEQFNDDLTRLQSALGGVVMEIASGMLPGLTDMTGQMARAAEETNSLKEFGEGLASVFGFVVNVVQSAAVVVAGFFEQLDAGIRMIDRFSMLDFKGGKAAWHQYQGASGAIGEALGDIWDPKRGAVPVDPRFAQVNSRDTRQQDLKRAALAGDKNAAKLLREQAEEQRKQAAQLRAILGGGGAEPAGGGSRKPRGGGGVDSAAREAARAAEEAARKAREAEEAQIRWHDSILDMEATLKGPLFEAQREFDKNMQRLNADFNDGKVKLADYAKGEELYREQLKKTTDEINGRKTALQEVIGDYAEEAKLLGMTRIEQEKYNAAKAAGVDLWSKEGQEIAAWVEKNASLREMRDLAEGLTASFEDMFGSFLDGSKSASEAWGDFMDDLTKQIMRFLASQALKQLFGALSKMGGNQDGATGGTNFWGQLFGAIFGGGKAAGGPVSGSKLYEVGEGGKPELFQQGGKTYLIPGNDGNVVPATSGVSAPSGGMQVIINNNAGAKVSARQEQGKGPDGSMLRRMVIDIVADSMNGGQLGVVTRNRFGLREAV